MSTMKSALLRIWHYLLSIVRSLGRLICCRRKKEVEYVLPMTIEHITEIGTQATAFENSEFKYQWESWSYNDKSQKLNSQATKTGSDTDSQTIQNENASNEDFFKDMVPQIRKQKKIFVENNIGLKEQELLPSTRLAMDPSLVVMSTELGVIEDNACDWETNEDSENVWDPDTLIREKKRAEQEKRRAEHQRRKEEKEKRKLSKPESLSKIMLSLSDMNDKHKYS